MKNDAKFLKDHSALHWKGAAFALAAFACCMLLAPGALAVTDDAENENVDAVSRWSDANGESGTVRKKAIVEVAKPLSPISESSFEREQSASRSPASEGRAPAAAAPVKVRATDMRVPPKAWARSLAKHKAYQEVAIIANENGFYPSTVFVTQGVPVRMFVTGASARAQCFMMDSFGVRRQIRSQKVEEIQFTPDQGGIFAFNCPMNGAKGSVVVKELSAAPTRIPASESLIRDEDFNQE